MTRLIAVLLLSALLAPGCGTSLEEPLTKRLPELPALLTKKGPDPAQMPAAPPPPLTAPPTVQEPLYDPSGKPDPFQPPVLESTLEQMLRTKKLMPLEQFEVSEFQLVSIVTGPGGNKAMVQDASGKGYLLTVGSKIGKNQGRVVAIVPRQVLIEEKTKDFLGRTGTKVQVLKIPQNNP
jgi:type IV pilus assembly protein PilP